jgi:chemotaxis protein MotA
MDLFTILGAVVGIGAVLLGMALEGGHLGSILQPTAFFIVVGGTLGAVMLQTPGKLFVEGLRMSGWAVSPPVPDYAGLTEKLFQLAQLARAKGPLALEDDAHRIEDPLIKKAMLAVVDGVDMDKHVDNLVDELQAKGNRLKQSARIWEAAGGYAPTIGILGAVLGLIHTMENLSDPAKLGGGIATAFVATVYGVGFANLIFLPLANKLKTVIQAKVLYWHIAIEGAYGIGKGENPRQLKARLDAMHKDD